jgi:hypothetical protein
MSPDEKLQILLEGYEKLQILIEGLEEIRQKLDDTISQIYDLAVEVDSRG